MDLEVLGVSAVVVIMGLVQLAKSMGFNSKYGGVLAMVLGIVASVGYTYYQDTELFRAIFMGIALGLSASGFYSTQKSARGL